MSTENAANTVEARPGLIRRTLRRQRVGLIVVWLTTTVIGLCLVWAMIKPTYKSYSILRAEPPAERLFGVGTSTETFEMFLQTQVNLITSPNVLAAAGTSPKVQNLPRIRTATDVIQELKKVVNVNVSPGTTLLEVSMTSPDSYESAAIVNAVVESFLKTNEEWADSTTRSQIKGLEDYLRTLNGRTEELERQWQEIVAKGDADSIRFNEDMKNKQNPEEAKRSTITMEEFKNLKSQIFALQLELVQAEAWAKELAAGTKAEVPAQDKEVMNKIMERRFKNDPEVIDLAAKMRAAQDKLDAAKRVSQNVSDPAVTASKQKLEALTAQYSQLWELKSTQWLEEAESGRPIEFSKQQIHDAELKVRELKTKEAALNKLAAELDVNGSKLATDAVKIQLLVDQRASLKNMQEAVQRRLEQLRYESRGDTKIRRINEATPSSKPVKDLRPIWMWLTPVAMLMSSFCFFLVVEAAIGPPRRLTISAEPLDE